ncbi:hypothetical protein DS745_21440 [Anaerobacillus alkaliphilus]|uniref:Uncharacterized protein n=1 Tax=Anaerobacillus alkaliphilus TaxID=1548597 RepID=A0A4Q0VLH1_9BACI|nr:hypothetical protein DS745_21440 [Anaerobacillus alkaliphilus]
MWISEIHKEITGYEGLCDITESGRVISLRSNRPMSRCNDEHGFHIVKLTNSIGETENHNVFELLKREFKSLDKSHFKGAIKAKYAKACKLLDIKNVN